MFSLYKRQSGQLHDPVLIDALLEGEVKIGEELTLRELGVFDSSFDAPLYQRVCFDGQEALDDLGDGQIFSGAIGKLLMESFFHLTKLQCPEVLSDLGQSLVLCVLNLYHPLSPH